jgi:hypothetical protein
MKLRLFMRPESSLMVRISGLLASAGLASAQTWTITSAPVQLWTCVASSADGIKLVAAGFIPVFAGPPASLPVLSGPQAPTWCGFHRAHLLWAARQTRHCDTRTKPSSYRVFRGGSWYDFAWDCRSAYRTPTAKSLVPCPIVPNCPSFVHSFLESPGTSAFVTAH